MMFELREYNVTPKIEERNEINIALTGDGIRYNNQIISDENKIKSIVSLLENYKDDILSLNQDRLNNYKGGRQMLLRIKFEDNNVLCLIGNTPSSEMANLYSKIRNEIVEIIEQ